MRKYIFLIILFPLIFNQCINPKTENENSNNSETSYQLPKVLLISTGTNEGYGQLAQGAVVAIQTFNRSGAIVSIKTRDILKYPDQLKEYNFLILSTALGYHDADRRYSLSFMSDFEIENIANFVYEGGVLIAGDNVGRNKLDGNDRISLYGQLNTSNWGLSKCFGVSMQEMNMKDYCLFGNLDSNLNGQFKDVSPSDLWILVGDSIHSEKLTTLASWKNEENEFPAMTQNEYGKGICFLLSSSYFLHPSNDGGYWSASQIQSFYELTLDAFNKKNKNHIRVNTWPNGYEQAFCVSLNATGKLKEFKRLDNYFSKEHIKPTYFVNGKVNQEVNDYLQQKKLQSNGFSRLNYGRNLFPACKNDIKENEIFWDQPFKGFRFPYSRTSFWGLMALNEMGYSYESSIGADNIENFLGTVFPYQIPISYNSYYTSTDILEISPTYHDDYYFFSDVLKTTSYTNDQQAKDAQLFSKYLLNYWEYAVKPYQGLMVFMGHPNYVGMSDTTLGSLYQLVSTIKNENTWITNMDEVADYWKQLSALNITVSSNENQIKIRFRSDSKTSISDFSMHVKQKPNKVEVKDGQITLIEKNDSYLIVLDAHDGQELVFSLKE
ncbi:MAG: hypothetical protein HOD63_14290 [Bacteroidetes bacterium]|jgi:hypothetical protein|nr:hypothetical protein [Bacteroidota bacterium]MBT5531133.1 hypothetical protein [Cytophagia bacterium]MBT3422434.1 hypothetical protein [Bacteroidota bacterium]MBT3801098.1 hypothetical protein [Bacteroidota bacterium]MBT3935965.1 hypothetical protein [Bacteroidota bacterium]